MHNHNSNEGGHKGMMWMMLICCALPLVFLVLSGSTLFSGGYLWPALVGVLLVGNIWMMFKGRRSDKQSKTGVLEQPRTDNQLEMHDEQEKKSCCH